MNIISCLASNLETVRGFLQLPPFPEDPALCPAATLKAYLSKV